MHILVYTGILYIIYILVYTGVQYLHINILVYIRECSIYIEIYQYIGIYQIYQYIDIYQIYRYTDIYIYIYVYTYWYIYRSAIYRVYMLVYVPRIR